MATSPPIIDPTPPSGCETPTCEELTTAGAVSGYGYIQGVGRVWIHNGVITRIPCLESNELRPVAGDTTVLPGDGRILVNSTAAARTVSLDPAADYPVGVPYTIKDSHGQAGTNNITIDADGAETIDGAGTKVLNTNWQTVTIYTDGSNWFTG